MRILRGKQKIGAIQGVEIYVDLTSMFKHKGETGDKITIEKSFGKLLIGLGVGVILISLFSVLSLSDFDLLKYILPTSVEYLLIYFAIPLFLYGAFLLRDRESFLNSERVDKATDLIESQIKKGHGRIILNDLMSVELLKLLDGVVSNSGDFTFLNLAKFIFQETNNAQVLEKRLGLTLNLVISKIQSSSLNHYKFDESYKEFFWDILVECLNLGSNKIDYTCVLYVLMRKYLKNVFSDLGINDLEINSLELWQKNEFRKINYYNKWKVLSKLKPTGPVNRAYTSRATPVLDEYATDLTALASRGEFTTSIGRETEITNFLRILQKTNGSAACLLIGEPGVGKTRLLKYLATKMSVEDVPVSLQDSRLVSVDLNKVLTKTGSIDAFKRVIQSCLEEVKSSGNIVLVFEEIGQVMTIREEGRMEVINLIINAVSEMELKVIATTNLATFNKYIKPVKALTSLFEIVQINEPNSYLSIQILIDEVDRLEKKYRVKVQIGAIRKIVEFAPRFEADRYMPDKGIDLLEESILLAKSQGMNYLNSQTAEKLISSKVGVNVGVIEEEESKRLLNLEEIMHKKVVGQEDAIKSIAMAIRRARAGLTDFKKRPIASFLFYGPTGVGKTESAKTLADVYYGSESLMVRIDMSEYQEESNLNRLIGYTDANGNFIGGYLTEAVKLRPFTLVLLDEIEKANKKVLDLFLQILDEGFITDGMGRRVDFTNTIIIMTSNVASEQIAEMVEKGEKYNDIVKETAGTLRKEFRIEFLNRFDKLIMFESLSREEIKKVVEIQLQNLNENMQTKGITIHWDEKMLNELSKQSYNPVYGARELKRVVQDNVEDMLANLIIQGRLKSGNDVYFEGLNVKEIK